MKKQLLTTLLTLFASITFVAQDVWFDTDNSVAKITFTTDCEGCSISTVANPDANDTEATNVLLWKIAASATTTKDNVGNKFLKYTFNNDLGIKPADFATLVVTVRLYFPSYQYFHNFDSSDRFRFYIGSKQVQNKLKETDEAGWYDLEFDFSSVSDITSDVISGDIRIIGQEKRFTNLDNDLDFYIDTITASVAPTLSVESELLESNSLRFLSNNVENTLEVSKQINSATIYNNLGVVLKKYSANTQFDVSSLPTGLYIFRAKLDNGEQKTLRFLKK